MAQTIPTWMVPVNIMLRALRHVACLNSFLHTVDSAVVPSLVYNVAKQTMFNIIKSTKMMSNCA